MLFLLRNSIKTVRNVCAYRNPTVSTWNTAGRCMVYIYLIYQNFWRILTKAILTSFSSRQHVCRIWLITCLPYCTATFVVARELSTQPRVGSLACKVGVIHTHRDHVTSLSLGVYAKSGISKIDFFFKGCTGHRNCLDRPTGVLFADSSYNSSSLWSESMMIDRGPVRRFVALQPDRGKVIRFRTYV